MAVLVTLALASSGCASGLDFRVDHRLSIQGPPDRSTAVLPLTVTWKDAGLGAASYAVLLDRDPMPPGHRLADLGDDTTGIYPVAAGQTSFRFPSVPDRRDVANSEKRHHEITVIALDGQGRRIGEVAGFVEVNVQLPAGVG